MAAINIVIPFTLITWAELTVDSNIAAILNGAVPLLVIVLAALTFHDEPITLNRLVGVLVGYVGVIVLVFPGLVAAAGGSEFTGEVALLGSTVAYAIGAVYSRRNIKGLRPMIPAVFQVAFAFVMVTVLAFVFENPLAVSWNAGALIAVLWLGLLGSGLAYLLMFRLLSRIGATATSQLAYLLPVVGIITGALMLGEAVDGRIVIGTGLILGGVALVGSKFGERRIWGRRAPGRGTLGRVPREYGGERTDRLIASSGRRPAGLRRRRRAPRQRSASPRRAARRLPGAGLRPTRRQARSPIPAAGRPSPAVRSRTRTGRAGTRRARARRPPHHAQGRPGGRLARRSRGAGPERGGRGGGRR